MSFRIEKDLIGEMKIPNDVYYGIHTKRALDNFDISNKKVNLDLIYALVEIKKAAAITNMELGILESDISEVIVFACDEIIFGNYDDNFILDAFQGGAGTSTNLNVNEVIANVALEKLGNKKGEYNIIHPINHVNMSQSTNDVYPTALKIACIRKIRKLADRCSSLQDTLQQKENEYSDILKLGRTQLMDAVPITVGQQFGAYARAISRDRWRIYKVEERIRTINIGGTAIGTGINANQKYVFLMTERLQRLTGLGLSRSEFLVDTTQNLDVFVEVSGLLKSLATNLIKISNDIRILSSGPKGGFGELRIPKVQAGSSIMPGKVNPVVLEAVIQSSMRVISNDIMITQAAYSGNLELNAFTPVIAEGILESLEMLGKSINKLEKKVLKDIEVDVDKCKEYLENSTAFATALIHHIGYDKASEVARLSLEGGKTIREIVLEKELIEKDLLDRILSLYQVTKVGIPGK